MSLLKIYITKLENLDGGLNLHPSLGRSLILLLAIRSPDRKASYPSPSSQKGLLARFAKPSCFMAFFASQTKEPFSRLTQQLSGLHGESS